MDFKSILKINSLKSLLKSNLFKGTILLSIMVYSIIISIHHDKSIKVNMNLSSGMIYNFETHRGSGGLFIQYYFYFENKKFYNQYLVFCDKSNIHAIKNILNRKTVQVVYDRSDIDNNRILITSKEYEYFNLQTPNEYVNIVRQVDSLVEK